MSLRFRYIAGLLLLIIVLQSCEKKNCLSSTGSKIEEERILSAFQYIDAYDNFQIYLQNDTVHKVLIETGEKLIPFIETYVQNDTLIIKDNNTCNFLKNYPERKLYISVDTLKGMSLNGASDLFTVDTFRVKSCSIRFLADIGSCDLSVDAYVFQLQIWYASGDFKVKGKAYSAYLSTEQTSFIYADSLESTICHAYNNSKGDIYTQSGKYFYYRIKNTGNIYYSGKPDTIIVQEHSGSGLLIKQN
ncbi:MAG: DUF2807 domain-containing protein [Bacteroidales bacterium]|nr:DUF2807 domain-containing protein [Bacteroidales bacterium]